MKLEIDKIILFKRRSTDKKEYRFKAGMLNIVTGAPATGKSSFLKILDYVFCGEVYRIPDVIALAAQWVGVLFHTDTMRHFLARRLLLSENKGSDDYYHLSCPITKDLAIEYPVVTKTGKDILKILDEIAGLDCKRRPNAEEVVTRLTFRDVLNFSMQSNQTMVSEDRLFENSERDSIRQSLKNHLPQILGIDDSIYLDSLEQLKAKEKELQYANGERQKVISLYGNLTESLKHDLGDARILKFLPPDIEIPENPCDMMPLVQTVIQKINEDLMPGMSNVALNTEANELLRLQKKADQISEEIMLLDDRKRRLIQIDDQMSKYREEVNFSCRRMEIIKWIRAVWNPEQGEFFPYHGTDSALEEYEALRKALDKWNSTAMNKGLFENYKITYQNELAALEKKLATKIALYESILAKIKKSQLEKQDAREMMATQKSAYRLIGRIEAARRLYANLDDPSISLKQIADIKIALGDLRKKVLDEKEKIHETKSQCLKILSDGMRVHLQDQEIPVVLKSLTPNLDDERLDIFLENDKGERRYLSRIGSTANHLAFHVALSCAIEEHLASVIKTPAARFVIYDQPKRPDNELRIINHEIAESVRKSGWQAIVLVEADAMFYDQKDKDIVHQVIHFAKGDGIVPKKWLRHDK